LYVLLHFSEAHINMKYDRYTSRHQSPFFSCRFTPRLQHGYKYFDKKDSQKQYLLFLMLNYTKHTFTHTQIVMYGLIVSSSMNHFELAVKDIFSNYTPSWQCAKF